MLDDLLTMRSGLAAFDEDAESPGNEDKFDEAPDPSAKNGGGGRVTRLRQAIWPAALGGYSQGAAGGGVN